jgi:small subunit ribosomal protein S8
MLTRIRNAQGRNMTSVTMPASKLKASLAQLLKDEGYVADFSVSEDTKPSLTVTLKYFQGKPVIESIKRISRPGLRSYAGSAELPAVREGLGISIISTSQGLMTDRQARSRGIGGEVLCQVF